jgi:hypothetical protein
VCDSFRAVLRSEQANTKNDREQDLQLGGTRPVKSIAGEGSPSDWPKDDAEGCRGGGVGTESKETSTHDVQQ